MYRGITCQAKFFQTMLLVGRADKIIDGPSEVFVDSLVDEQSPNTPAYSEACFINSENLPIKMIVAREAFLVVMSGCDLEV